MINFEWPLVNPPRSKKFVAALWAGVAGSTAQREQPTVDGASGWAWQQSWQRGQALGEGGRWPQGQSNAVTSSREVWLWNNCKIAIPSYQFSAVFHTTPSQTLPDSFWLLFSHDDNVCIQRLHFLILNCTPSLGKQHFLSVTLQKN